MLKRLFAPYIIVAHWGKPRVHYAWTRREAFQWLSAYPASATVCVACDAIGFVAARVGRSA